MPLVIVSSDFIICAAKVCVMKVHHVELELHLLLASIDSKNGYTEIG